MKGQDSGDVAMLYSVRTEEENMADEAPKQPTAQNQFLPYVTEATPVKIVSDIPTIFADGVVNQIMGPGISKFYFFRNDAILGTINTYQPVGVAQMVMPAYGFVDMVAFFEHRLKVMLNAGNITQAMVDERREFYSKLSEG